MGDTVLMAVSVAPWERLKATTMNLREERRGAGVLLGITAVTYRNHRFPDQAIVVPTRIDQLALHGG